LEGTVTAGRTLIQGWTRVRGHLLAGSTCRGGRHPLPRPRIRPVAGQGIVLLWQG
jgi:hypothetical protein